MSSDDLDLEARRLELARETGADPRARAVAGRRVDDRERVLGAHADHDVGASAFLIASCSSSDS